MLTTAQRVPFQVLGLRQGCRINFLSPSPCDPNTNHIFGYGQFTFPRLTETCDLCHFSLCSCRVQNKAPTWYKILSTQFHIKLIAWSFVHFLTTCYHSMTWQQKCQPNITHKNISQQSYTLNTNSSYPFCSSVYRRKQTSGITVHPVQCVRVHVCTQNICIPQRLQDHCFSVLEIYLVSFSIFSSPQ